MALVRIGVPCRRLEHHKTLPFLPSQTAEHGPDQGATVGACPPGLEAAAGDNGRQLCLDGRQLLMVQGLPRLGVLQFSTQKAAAEQTPSPCLAPRWIRGAVGQPMGMGHHGSSATVFPHDCPAWTPELCHNLERWLQEDLGRGDLSAPAVGGCSRLRRLLAKAPGCFCGGPLAARLFQLLNPAVRVQVLVADGNDVVPGTELLRLHGPAAALLAGERVALNLAMRLSGVATATAHLVGQLTGSGIHLVDTRKTTPGLRLLEKYAVRCGGGLNHRMGLDDAVMLKENHLAWCGGIVPALERVRAQAPWPVSVIVEAESDAEAQAAVGAGAEGFCWMSLPRRQWKD